MVVIDLFILIQFLFKIMCYPFTHSVEFIMQLGRTVKNKGDKMSLKILKSCSPLKVELGMYAVFDRLTSLMIWRLVIDVAITFLLI